MSNYESPFILSIMIRLVVVTPCSQFQDVPHMTLKVTTYRSLDRHDYTIEKKDFLNAKHS